MTAKPLARIFRQGSRTYFYSSLFFPAEVKKDVFALYAFVRVADDFVDRVPQDAAGLAAFEARYHRAAAGETTGDLIVDGFVDLARRRGFEEAWVEAFLAAMRSDLARARYDRLADVEQYMYGSAEVIGLMMARVMGLPDSTFPEAQRLGKAMQYVNFLRDVAEDGRLGRRYVPTEILAEHGLARLDEAEATAHPERFAALMRAELQRYRRWQSQAEAGYAALPARMRVPIQTAADMYLWTADVIARDPTVVFRRKVKPSVPRIVERAAVHALRAILPAAPRAVASGLDRLRPWVG